MDEADTPDGQFATRLLRVLDGRKPTPWAQRLGIPAGTRARMFKQNIPPTYETLVKIMRVENASLTWLLGGDVPPFLVTRTGSDAETAERLHEHYTDADWKTVLLVGEDRSAWMLTMPGSLADSRGEIPYTEVQLVAGPSGRLAGREWQRAHPQQGKPSVRNIGPNYMHLLYAGQLGTYALVGDDDAPGLLDPYKHYEDPPGLAMWLRDGEVRPYADIRQRLDSDWDQLRDDERLALAIVMEPLLDRVEDRGDDSAETDE